MILFGYIDNYSILLGDGEPWGSSFQGAWFSSRYVISIDTGHITQSPQCSPRWSLAFKMEPVLNVSSFNSFKVSIDLPLDISLCFSENKY